jgi:hypothetical protein
MVKKGIYLVLVLTFVFSVMGCLELLEAFAGSGSSYSSSSSSGCQGDGACVLITDSDGDGAYSWCRSSSCRVGTTTVGKNQNIRCNC